MLNAQLMFANLPRNGKFMIGVFFNHDSYSQCFFHSLSFFGAVAIFNSAFFQKFKDNLNYTNLNLNLKPLQNDIESDKKCPITLGFDVFFDVSNLK